MPKPKKNNSATTSKNQTSMISLNNIELNSERCALLATILTNSEIKTIYDFFAVESNPVFEELMEAETSKSKKQGKSSGKKNQKKSQIFQHPPKLEIELNQLIKEKILPFSTEEYFTRTGKQVTSRHPALLGWLQTIITERQKLQDEREKLKNRKEEAIIEHVEIKPVPLSEAQIDKLTVRDLRQFILAIYYDHLEYYQLQQHELITRNTSILDIGNIHYAQLKTLAGLCEHPEISELSLKDAYKYVIKNAPFANGNLLSCLTSNPYQPLLERHPYLLSRPLLSKEAVYVRIKNKTPVLDNLLTPMEHDTRSEHMTIDIETFLMEEEFKDLLKFFEADIFDRYDTLLTRGGLYVLSTYMNDETMPFNHLLSQKIKEPKIFFTLISTEDGQKFLTEYPNLLTQVEEKTLLGKTNKKKTIAEFIQLQLSTPKSLLTRTVFKDLVDKAKKITDSASLKENVSELHTPTSTLEPNQPDDEAIQKSLSNLRQMITHSFLHENRIKFLPGKEPLSLVFTVPPIGVWQIIDPHSQTPSFLQKHITQEAKFFLLEKLEGKLAGKAKLTKLNTDEYCITLDPNHLTTNEMTEKATKKLFTDLQKYQLALETRQRQLIPSPEISGVQVDHEKKRVPEKEAILTKLKSTNSNPLQLRQQLERTRLEIKIQNECLLELKKQQEEERRCQRRVEEEKKAEELAKRLFAEEQNRESRRLAKEAELNAIREAALESKEAEEKLIKEQQVFVESKRSKKKKPKRRKPKTQNQSSGLTDTSDQQQIPSQVELVSIDQLDQRQIPSPSELVSTDRPDQQQIPSPTELVDVIPTQNLPTTTLSVEPVQVKQLAQDLDATLSLIPKQHGIELPIIPEATFRPSSPRFSFATDHFSTYANDSEEMNIDTSWVTGMVAFKPAVPKFIVDIFEKDLPPPADREGIPEVAAVGGIVIAIIRNETIILDETDFDFAGVANTQFFDDETNGYENHKIRKNLWKKTTPSNIRIDYTDLGANNTSNWMYWDAYLNRDFTACTVYMSKDGSMYDPTGRGLDAIRTKTLSTVHDAKSTLDKDPKRLLRAIKYKLKDFKWDAELKNELLNWEVKSLEKLDEATQADFHKTLRNYLVHYQFLNRRHPGIQMKFVNELIELGLLEKIYKINAKLRVSDQFTLLATKVGYRLECAMMNFTPPPARSSAPKPKGFYSDSDVTTLFNAPPTPEPIRTQIKTNPNETLTHRQTGSN